MFVTVWVGGLDWKARLSPSHVTWLTWTKPWTKMKPFKKIASM